MAKRRVYDSLMMDRVDLVDRGANFDRATGDGSHILLLKRQGVTAEKQELVCPSCSKRLHTGYGETGTTIPNYCPECGAKISLKATTKQEQPPMSATATATEDLQKTIDAAVAKALAAERAANAEKVAKAEADAKAAAEVEKAAIEKRLKEAEDKVAKAEEIAKAETERREIAEHVAKADAYKSLSLKPAEDGALFFRLSKAMTAEDVTRLHEILASANEIARVGGVFKEAGRSHNAGDASGNPEEKLLAKAAELRAADPKLSEPDSIAKAREQFPDLRIAYTKWMAERTGTKA